MEKVFISLLNTSITAGYLVIAVMLLRPLLRKAPKYIRCILWSLVGLRLVLPFSFESKLSVVPSAQPVPPEIVTSPTPVINSGFSALNAAVNPVISESMAPTPEASVNPMQIAMGIAWNIWLVGMIVLVIYSIVSFILLKRKLREAVRTDGNVFLCDRVSSPFLLGLFVPKIYLPSSLSEDDKLYVLAHENAHIRRKDHWWKPLGFLLLTVYWFNPFMWVAYIFLCRDIEFACDEKVIRQLGADCKKSYSQALINCSIPRKMISACPVAFGENSVKGRIKSVLNYKKPAFWIILIALIICVVVAVCFLTNPPGKDLPEASPSNKPDNTLGTPTEMPYGTEYKFTARVVEVHDEQDYFIVEYTPKPIFNHTLPNPQQYRIYGCPPHITVGQDVMISYDGSVMATSTLPPILGKIYNIEILNVDIPPDHTFNVTVIAVYSDSVLVKPFVCEDEISSIGQEIVLRLTPSQLNGMQVGDNLQITYDGQIEKLYPPILPNITGIIRLPSELSKLQETHPEFFGCNTARGLEVYVWKNDGWRCGVRSVTNQTPTIEDLWLLGSGITLNEMALILTTYGIPQEDVSILYSYNPAFSGKNPAPPSPDEQAYIESILLPALPNKVLPAFYYPAELSPHEVYPLTVCAYKMSANSWRFKIYENSLLQEAMQDAVWGVDGLTLEEAKESLKRYDIPADQIPVVVVASYISSFYGIIDQRTTEEARTLLSLN